MSAARSVQLVALAALLIAVASAATARPLVVIASTMASLPAGKIIDSDAAIALPPDAQVTLIGPDGRNLELRGPYNGKPALGVVSKADDPTLVSRLSHLFETTTSDNAMPGGVRGGTEARPPGAWSIDIAHGGTYCVAGIDTLRLWRGHAGTPFAASIRPANAGAPVNLSWDASDMEVPWPAGLPLTPEAKFLIRHQGEALPTVIVLRALPAELPNNAERAAWMGENGCAAQARRLLQSGS